MPSITPARFRVRFPEFSDATRYSDELVTMFIEDTLLEMDEAVWGMFMEKGQAALVAHYIAVHDLTRNEPGSDAGSVTHRPVTYEVEGDTHIGYWQGPSASVGKETLIGATLYGQQFLELRSKVVIGVASSGSGRGSLPRTSTRAIPRLLNE